MAWYADLSPCDYFGAEVAALLRAVGWLQRDRPFPVTPVDRRVYDRLVELRREPWQPMAAAGRHHCELCQYESEACGASNLFIPASSFLYVCPELITHYMNAHGYAPPPDFCEAVLACPPMRSRDYFRALLASGGRPLAKRGRA